MEEDKSHLKYVRVTAHAVQNMILRGIPKDLKKRARKGFRAEYFMAGMVMAHEDRSKKQHPKIGEDVVYRFTVMLPKNKYPLGLTHNIILIVADEYEDSSKKWVIVTAMTEADYHNRVAVEEIRSKGHGKIPGTKARGIDVLENLLRKREEES